MTNFLAFRDKCFLLCYSPFRLLTLRHSQLENLRASSSNLIPSLEPLELQMQLLNTVSDFDKQLWHFARLLFTHSDFIKNFGGNTFMRFLSFDSIQKKLDKKNAELAKVRSLRKKLADREKIIFKKSKLSSCRSNAKSSMRISMFLPAPFFPCLRLYALVSLLLSIQAQKKKL